MTQREYTLNLYLGLYKTIQKESERLNEIKERFNEAKEANDTELMIYLAKQYKLKEAQNLNRIAQYHDLEASLELQQINNDKDNSKCHFDELEPWRLLCDQVWNKRSNR